MDKPHRWSTVGNFDVHLQDFSHLQSTMRGSEVTSTSRALEFRDRLTSSGRDVDERLEDLGKAIQWVAEQLRTMKDQDRSIMKKFATIRADINKIKETKSASQPRRASLDIPRISEAGEFDGVRACNKDPFDLDDTIPLRRRAITTMELASNRIIDDEIKLRHQTK